MKIAGIIYPIPSFLVNRIKKNKEFIFVKNPTHESLPKYIDRGDKILFYCKKEIIAEATINAIHLQYLQDILKLKDILQTREELEDYSSLNSKKFKKQIVFELSKVKAYNFIKCPFYITMTGRYITSKDYKDIINQ